jgi:hypothetical protein
VRCMGTIQVQAAQRLPSTLTTTRGAGSKASAECSGHYPQVSNLHNYSEAACLPSFQLAEL